MIGVSLPPVVAWELLYGDRRVLNLPEPAPMPHVCETCKEEGGDSDVPGGCWCRFEAPPLRVAIHTTSEWPDDGPPLHGDPLVTPDRKGVAGVLGDGSSAGHVKFMPFDSVVAVATITGSHEAKLAQNAGGFHATCCGNSDVPFLPTHHWLVGSVRPITPIPWERFTLDDMTHEMRVDPDTGLFAGPVWRVPAELASRLPG